MKKVAINREFLVLQTIGIILVVVGHRYGSISLFSDWFPIYSFHMPLFIFISGYFYRESVEQNIGAFFIKKVKSLLIPFFIWNIIYGFGVAILRMINIVNYGAPLSLNNLFITPWMNGHQFGLNVATWFIPALFLVQMIYAMTYKLFGCVKLVDRTIIGGILYFLGGLIGVQLAIHGYNESWQLTIVRLLFLLPFYYIGHVYKIRLEQYDRVSSTYYFLFLFFVQYLIFTKYDNLDFSVAFCNNFNNENIFLPFITSITGIMFWLRVSKILCKSIGNSRVIETIGLNTSTIMYHHQFIFFLMNFIFFVINKYFPLENFDAHSFKTNPWYIYNLYSNKFLIFYVILGIYAPIIGKKFVNKIYWKWIKSNFNKLK